MLATRIDGNVGMLGVDYPGLVGPDDAQALAQRLRQCRTEQVQGTPGLLATWQQQGERRAPLFDPATEQAALQAWVQALRATP